MNALLRNLYKHWKIILLPIITLSFVSLISYAIVDNNNRFDEVHKIEWIDIGHVTYVLPLFNGQNWLYRYDVKTNAHGNITLREEGLPQANMAEPLFEGCNFYSFSNHLHLNQTVGITYYPTCGYLIVIQNEKPL